MPIWMQIFLSLALMIFGAFMDGISNRPENVGWIPWHVFNWARRDLLILLLYLNLGWQYLKSDQPLYFDQRAGLNSFYRRLAFALSVFFLLLVFNDILHHFFYHLGLAARPFLDWGHTKPGWLP